MVGIDSCPPYLVALGVRELRGWRHGWSAVLPQMLGRRPSRTDGPLPERRPSGPAVTFGARRTPARGPAFLEAEPGTLSFLNLF